MMDLGQLLRQTRESQELSLADVESSTRIRQRYLAALESGDWEELPNDIVARGFLRAYARFLGLDAEELVRQFETPTHKNNSQVSAEPAASQPVEYRPIDLDLYDVRPDRFRWLRRLLGMLLVLAPVVALVFVLVRYGLPLLLEPEVDGVTPAIVGTLPPAGTPPATPLILIGVTETPTTTPTSEPEPESQNEGGPVVVQPDTPTAAPTLQPTPEGTPTPAQQIALRLEVTQRAWIRLVVDGALRFEGIRQPGFQETFTAQQGVQMRTGNAAGVRLTVNGQEYADLGDTGQIVDLAWRLEEGVVIEVVPTPDVTPFIPTATPTAAEQTPTITPTATPTP